MIKQALIIAALACASLGARAEVGTLEFSYDNSGQWGYWGTELLENYDMAIHINNPQFAGKEITSISVPVRDDAGLKNFHLWMSKELTLQKKGSIKIVVPDVLDQAIEPKDGKLTYTFTEPYVIPAEGIYIGYSFEVPSLTNVNAKNPVRLSVGSNPEGFYFHGSRSYLKFIPISEEYNACVPFSVMIRGDYPSESVSIGSMEEIYSQIGDNSKAQVYLINQGTRPVTSVDYSYTIDGTANSGHYDFTTPIEPNFTRNNKVLLPIVTDKPEGNYAFTLSIDKVNGQPNTSTNNTATSQIILKTTVPKHLAVVEEYTGLWCGFCPKGYVALEKMNKLYPEEFIGLSYHKGDDMQIMDSKDFPVNIIGYPEAWIDRSEKIDAYFGWERTTFGLDKVWEAYCAQYPLAAISVYAGWNEDEINIEADTHVTFIKDADNSSDKYQLVYFLVGNGLEDANWVQSNNYTNNGAYYMDQDMKIFTDGGSGIKGLVYNDIVIQCENSRGLAKTIPSAIKKDQDMAHHYTFNTTKAVNAYGSSLLEWTDDLDVVVLLVDQSTEHGKIINAAKVKVAPKYTAIHNVNAAERHETGRYGVDGRRISIPQPGVNIVTYSDGTVSKVIVK